MNTRGEMAGIALRIHEAMEEPPRGEGPGFPGKIARSVTVKMALENPPKG